MRLATSQLAQQKSIITKNINSMDLILFGIGMCILLAAGLFYFIYKSLIELYEKIEELDKER